MQGVYVTSFKCRKTRIKRCVDDLGPVHHNIARQKTIEAAHPRPWIAMSVAIKMHYLPKGMHSGIGSPSSSDSDRIGVRTSIANESINGVLYFILYGVLTRLRLPPNKSGAVVL
jgi:hypothetical protein